MLILGKAKINKHNTNFAKYFYSVPPIPPTVIKDAQQKQSRHLTNTNKCSHDILFSRFVNSGNNRSFR